MICLDFHVHEEREMPLVWQERYHNHGLSFGQNRAAGGGGERGCDVQRYTIEDKRSKGLPEATFTIINDYYDTLPDAPPQTEEYYKWEQVIFTCE